MSPRAAKAASTLLADEDPSGTELFRYEARRDGRTVVFLRAVDTGGSVTVETEVFPVTEQPGQGALRRPFSFANADQARRFVDEALTALEYLNCSVGS